MKLLSVELWLSRLNWAFKRLSHTWCEVCINGFNVSTLHTLTWKHLIQLIIAYKVNYVYVHLYVLFIAPYASILSISSKCKYEMQKGYKWYIHNTFYCHYVSSWWENIEILYYTHSCKKWKMYFSSVYYLFDAAANSATNFVYTFAVYLHCSCYECVYCSL